MDYGREDGGDNEQVGKVCPPVAKHGHAQTKGFAAATAEVTGESKRAINLNVARAEAIGDDLLRLTGTSLDKGVELDALAKLPEPERKELIERAVAGGFVTVTKPNRACFPLRSTTKDSNCPMENRSKQAFCSPICSPVCPSLPSQFGLNLLVLLNNQEQKSQRSAGRGSGVVRFETRQLVSA